jgi:hypothetical protein
MIIKVPIYLEVDKIDIGDSLSEEVMALSEEITNILRKQKFAKTKTDYYASLEFEGLPTKIKLLSRGEALEVLRTKR